MCCPRSRSGKDTGSKSIYPPICSCRPMTSTSCRAIFRRCVMKRKIIAVTFIAALCSAPALAIFGLGDIVFDPTNFEEAVRQLLQMEQQYVQLVQTYQMVTNQYQQMIWMAKQVPVNMASRYRALATPWHLSSA